MENTNCLEGMKCPKCGSLGSYTIGVTATVRVSDNGTDECGNIEWTDDSFCECDDCGHCGIVKDFK